MRENFTYGTVGRAPGNRCLYPEPDRKSRRVFRIYVILSKTSHLPIPSLAFPAGDFYVGLSTTDGGIRMADFKALVVDDDQGVRHIVIEFLANIGIEAQAYETAEELLA